MNYSQLRGCLSLEPASLTVLLVCVCNAFLIGEIQVTAAAFQGASAVLQKVAELKQSSATNSAARTPIDQLREELNRFRTNGASMSAPAAAARWLELIDQQEKLALSQVRLMDPNVEPVTPHEVFSVLPGPSTWTELSKAVRARASVQSPGNVREIGLRLLAACLTGDHAARQAELSRLQEMAAKADGQSRYSYRSLLSQIGEATLGLMEDPEAVIKSLEFRMEAAAERSEVSLSIPNLVPLVGAAKTEAFLRRALEHDNVLLELPGETETSRLARKLGLELVAKMKKPQWGLVNSLDGVELYEAMDARFAKGKSTAPAVPAQPVPGLPDLMSIRGEDQDYRKTTARAYHLLGLIAKDRSQEAAAVARSFGRQANVYLPRNALKAMERSGFTRSLDEFLFTLLTADPTLPFWDDYVPLAAKAGQTERMLALARSVSERQDLSAAKRTEIRQMRVRALLAADQVNQGVEELRRLLQIENPPTRAHGQQTQAELALHLARIGMVLKRPEWIEEGVRVGLKSVSTEAGRSEFGWGEENAVVEGLAGILGELRRGPDVEAMILQALGRVKPSPSEYADYSFSGADNANTPLLVNLARAYHEAGRGSDVIALLVQSPDWGVKDLKELGRHHNGYSGWVGGRPGAFVRADMPVLYLAASSLMDVGRKEEALRTLGLLLDSSPGFDPGYELLLRLNGEGAVAKLDELYSRDRFEERPLIWKAELLRRLSRFEEAEKTARLAISIDPSDGEQGPGDRLRAYSVLADVRQARGDAKEAGFLRGAVSAIRLSEEADRFYAAGLLKQAIAMYEASLKQFADAYCIQSRLAVQLAELGRHEEAEAHYRKAYELMPDSFGRVESHCFGCERAFEGQRAQGMAEKIFQDLAVKTPDKPQVHYLLGYLRMEQERHGEALQHFQTAVRLDPDYLSAWQSLQASAEHLRLPARERDTILLNLLRLDPLQRHVQVSVERITDLAALWNALERGSKAKPAEPAELMSLTASRAALLKAEQERRAKGQGSRVFRSGGFLGSLEDAQPASPAVTISQSPFVRAALEMLGMTLIEE